MFSKVFAFSFLFSVLMIGLFAIHFSIWLHKIISDHLYTSKFVNSHIENRHKKVILIMYKIFVFVYERVINNYLCSQYWSSLLDRLSVQFPKYVHTWNKFTCGVHIYMLSRWQKCPTVWVICILSKYCNAKVCVMTSFRKSRRSLPLSLCSISGVQQLCCQQCWEHLRWIVFEKRQQTAIWPAGWVSFK
jgi:hypothetical protein